MTFRSISLATMGAAGAYLLLRAATAQNGGEQPQIMLASLPAEPTSRPTGLQRVLPILSGVLDLADMTPVFGGGSAPETPATRQTQPSGGGIADWVGNLIGGLDLAPNATPSRNTGGANLDPLLSLIRQHESAGNYNAFWGRISGQDRPPRALTSMTIGEVLAWQDSIDHKYMSEAAGAYQFLEDTLRSHYRKAGLSTGDLFNRANQDRLAVSYLDVRGLARYRSGQITAEQFAQNIAKAWASFPAIGTDKRGRRATGQSYHAGDGLNRASVTQTQALNAVRAI